MKNFTLVIPAYNEEKRIKNSLQSILKTFGPDINILVVSNGSIDKTLLILEDWKKRHKNFDFLDFPQKLGKGGAILEGLKMVDTKYMGFMDADDAFDIVHIKRIIEEKLIRENIDCVIASKWKGKNFSEVTEPFFRKVLSRGWNFLMRTFLNLKFYDTQAGAKFFKKEVYDRVSKNFICRKFSFDVELLYKIKKEGFIIKEEYVSTVHREGSTYRLRDCIPMFIDLIRLWWSKF